MIEHKYQAPHPESGETGCVACGELEKRHRVRKGHVSRGDPCEACGLPKTKHRTREYLSRQWKRDKRKGSRRKSPRKRRASQERLIIGIDGEGHDLPDGRHVYTYLAAVSEHGRLVAQTRFAPKGLSHEECAEMLVSLPKRALKFAFMFSYDVTMILRDWPREDIYRLLRPDSRRSRTCLTCKEKTGKARSWPDPTVTKCPKCKSEKTRPLTPRIRFRGRGYDYFAGSFIVSQDYRKGRGWKASTRIWDVFRFFQCSFVEALRAWKISNEPGEEKDGKWTTPELDKIAKMKGKRGKFADEKPEDVRKYCQVECHLLARLMRAVKSSHEEAGIPLTRYEGAGSSASSLMKKHGVADYRGPRLESLPGKLQKALLCAYFGGRFENSVIGRVDRPLFSADISSAYPYAETFLPCLSCGKWEWCEGRGLLARIEESDLAVCQYEVAEISAYQRETVAWMPLPCRDEKGSIIFGSGFSGWAHKPEMLAALKGWGQFVKCTGAWIYSTDCIHKPFGFLPSVYRQRLAWGKEGKGIALKLASNACAGKTMQTLGDAPPFLSWPWAGMITATTRAQSLDAICRAKERWNVLSVATDGIYATEEIALPRPENTGTGDLPKPLGGWETKTIPEGGLFVKPGLYYRLDASMGEIRARGVGRKEVYEEKEKLLKGWESWDRQDFSFGVTLKSRRFFGAKHSIFGQSQCLACGTTWPGLPRKRCSKCRRIGDVFRVSELSDDSGKSLYRAWREREIEIRFDPRPKREAVMDGGRLRIRDLGGRESLPYEKGRMSPEASGAREAKEWALEQPDWEERA